MDKYINNVTNASGDVIVGASIQVTTLSGSNAVIYATDGGAPVTNPLTSGENGYFEFYANDGQYKLTVSGPGIKTFVIADIRLSDSLPLLTEIKSRVYGPLTADPTVDPQGNAPTVGDEYYNTVLQSLKRFNGTTWLADISPSSLAAVNGAALSGYLGDEIQAVFDNAKPMQNYTALRAYTGRAIGVRITTPGLAGIFQRSTTDTTSADNGGTVIVDASGRRWARLNSWANDVRWWGAVGDGVADDTAALRAAIAAVDAGLGGIVQIPNRVRVTDTITLASFYKITLAGVSMASRIIFDNSVAGKPLLLLTNESSHLGFDKLHLVDTVLRTSVAISIVGTNVAGVASWKNTFTSVRIEGFGVGADFTTATPLSGSTHAQASENTFIHCKFRDCAISVRLNNGQSVNNNFFAVDAENTYTGDTASIIVQDNSGGGLNWTGGSIITRGRIQQLRWPAGATNLFADGVVTLRDIRFEIRPGHIGVLIDDDPTAQSPGSRFANINWLNCSVLNQAGPGDLMRYAGRLTASFIGVRVTLTPMTIRQFPVTGRTANDTGGSQGSVKVDGDCRGISAVRDLAATYGATNAGAGGLAIIDSHHGTSDGSAAIDTLNFRSAGGARASMFGRFTGVAPPINRLVFADPNVSGGFMSQKLLLPVNAQPLRFCAFKNPLRLANAHTLSLFVVKDSAAWVTAGTFDKATDAVLVSTIPSTAGKAGNFSADIQLTAAWFGGGHFQVGQANWLEGRVFVEVTGSAENFSGMYWIEYF